MISQRFQQFVHILFKRLLSLHKIQFNSFLPTLILLLLKSVLGTFLIMILFFADQIAFDSMTQTIKQIIIYDQNNQNTTCILTCSIFSFINILTLLLFFNFFKKHQSEVIDKILMVVLISFQTFKYLIILIVCSEIRSLFLHGKAILIIINSINLILFLFWNFIFQNFYFTFNYSTKNLFARFKFQINVVTQIFITLLVVVLSFIGPDDISHIFKIIINTIFLVTKGLFIYEGLLKWLYIHRSIQQIYSFLLMTQVITLLANMIIHVTGQNLLKQNFILCVSITSTFCYFGWKAYFDWNQQDIYFTKGKDIKSQGKATIYLKAIHDIISKVDQNQNTSLILASIKKQHEIQCKKTTCYCQTQLELQFIRQYLLEQLEDVRNIFKNNPNILIQQLNIRFYIFNGYPQILNKLEYIKTHFALGLTEQYSLVTLKNQVIKLVQQKNITNHTIDVQNPLRLEQISNKLQSIIKKDVQKKTKKWKYLSRGICRVEELQQDINIQISNIKQITSIHQQEIIKFKRSVIFNLLIMFYYKKIAFININTEEIQKNLNDQLKKIKQQELYSTKQFSKWIFHKRSCVIESLIDQVNMGTITRSSKNIYEMFGYHQHKVVGMNLNKLMPQFMSMEHDNIIKNWIKTGHWNSIAKLKEIFCIHKQQFCFTGFIYLKVIANQKGLYFIGVVFKKNESDYLILNQKQQIEGLGRKFSYLVGPNCRRLPMKLLCKDFPTLDLNKEDDYKYYTKQMYSLSDNSSLGQKFIQQKNRKYLNDQQEKVFINQYQKKIQQKNVQRWQVKFGLKIFKMRQLSFYVVLLNYAKKVSSFNKNNNEQNNNNNETTLNELNQTNEVKSEVIVGTGRINQDEEFQIQSQNNPSDMTIGQKHAEFYQQKNSSMVSFAQRQSFTLSKLLRVFYEYLINPSSIRNKRINTLNISTLLETILLTTLVSVSFIIYISSLLQIKSYVSANSQINQNMQLAILMYNKVVSISQYQKDSQTLNKFLITTSKDLDQFYQSLARHVANVNNIVSEFHSQWLYQYLNTPVDYMYQRNKTRKIQVLQFLQLYYYMTIKISQDVMVDNKLDVIENRQFQFDRIKWNFPQLKNITTSICDNFKQMTQRTKYDLIIVAWSVMVSFFIITLIFFLYTYNYFSFRYQQKHQCLEIYSTIPSILIDRTKEYYQSFYNQLFINSNNKITNIEANLQNLNKNQFIIQANLNLIQNHKIKFIGKQKFLSWIKSLLMFFAINTVNILITYQIVTFVEPLNSFMGNINSIMDSQNKLLESYLDIKGAYLLAHKPKLNATTIDPILKLMNQNQVTFNQMIMFTSDTLTLYDPNFYQDFYQILVDNVCLQIKDNLDLHQYNDCMSVAKTGIIDDGVITYMNYFQRKVRSVLQDLKVNNTLRFTTEGKKYFMNRGFKEVDLAMSYNIKIFRKLIQRILDGYKKGIQYISFINVIVLILLISPQIINLVMWFHLVKQQKAKLSLLYGSMLMIPPNVIRHVKNLPRSVKKILQFSQN